jgi:hypothetical protein
VCLGGVREKIVGWILTELAAPPIISLLRARSSAG